MLATLIELKICNERHEYAMDTIGSGKGMADVPSGFIFHLSPTHIRTDVKIATYAEVFKISGGSR